MHNHGYVCILYICTDDSVRVATHYLRSPEQVHCMTYTQVCINCHCEAYLQVEGTLMTVDFRHKPAFMVKEIATYTHTKYITPEV